MKKTVFILLAMMFCTLQAFCETNFTKAVINCDSYSLDGSIPYQGEVFNVKITLQKSKGKCVYKEKIYQDIGYQQLTCNFGNGELKFIADSMNKYSDMFKKQIAKNRIFEAKLTSNGEILQKYLVEPKYCQINYSKK